MSSDEKIRLGLAALSVVTAAVAAAHLGHIPAPLLDAIGPGGSS